MAGTLSKVGVKKTQKPINQGLLKDQGYLSVQRLPKINEDSTNKDILSTEDGLRTEIDQERVVGWYNVQGRGKLTKPKQPR